MSGDARPLECAALDLWAAHLMVEVAKATGTNVVRIGERA
jgi:hypothetical protein